MAQDLNLHRKTTSKLPSSVDDSVVLQWEREILNRERTWIYCFIIDRSLSAQMGKPYSIREDYIIRNSKTWHLQRCSAVQDLGLVAMVDLHRTFVRSHLARSSICRLTRGRRRHASSIPYTRTGSRSRASTNILTTTS